jgi:hypothetical protein
MELTAVEFYINGKHRTINIPKNCPNCGIGNNPTNNSLVSEMDCNIFSHYCISCRKYHYTVQSQFADDISQLLLVYPNQVVVDIDELFIKHTPNFATVYSEAIQAEKADLPNIAGMGYRLAIECLIKDYALLFDLATTDELTKLNFNNCIDKFMKDDELLKNAIHTVRKIGNDYSHWKKEYDLPLPTLKAYAEIVIIAFKMKLMMKFPPV